MQVSICAPTYSPKARNTSGFYMIVPHVEGRPVMYAKSREEANKIAEQLRKTR